jgi:hypothetical protein
LEIPVSARDDKVRYPDVIIEDEPIRAVAGGEWDRFPIGVQLPFEVLHFVSESEVTESVLLLSFLNGGGEALGNVEYGGWVVLVELHHIVSSVGEDGS